MLQDYRPQKSHFRSPPSLGCKERGEEQTHAYLSYRKLEHKENLLTCCRQDFGANEVELVAEYTDQPLTYSCIDSDPAEAKKKNKI